MVEERVYLKVEKLVSLWAFLSAVASGHDAA